MTDLRHNEPLVKEMFKAYWANYRIKPDAAEIAASVEWGMSQERDVLEHALDVDNHGDLSQNRNPRLFDLKRLANSFREARGDFYRAPLPDTCLPEEPQCLYCAEGDVYDFVFVGDKWSIRKTGTCAVCSGGTARGNPVFVEMAEILNINVGKIVWQFSLALLEYKLTHGLLKITKTDIESALEVFRQKTMSRDKPQGDRYTRSQMTVEQLRQEWLAPDISPHNTPERPAAPAKGETGKGRGGEVCPKPETPVETPTEAKDYDFGDGFVRENDSIPF